MQLEPAIALTERELELLLKGMFEQGKKEGNDIYVYDSFVEASLYHLAHNSGEKESDQLFWKMQIFNHQKPEPC